MMGNRSPAPHMKRIPARMRWLGGVAVLSIVATMQGLRASLQQSRLVPVSIQGAATQLPKLRKLHHSAISAGQSRPKHVNVFCSAEYCWVDQAANDSKRSLVI